MGLVTAAITHRRIYDYFGLTFLGLLSKSTVSVHRVSGDLAEGSSGLPWLTLESSSQLKAFQTKLFVGLSCYFRSGSLCVKDDVLLHRTEDMQTPYPPGEQRNGN